jgi:hypothetical protein
MKNLIFILLFLPLVLSAQQTYKIKIVSYFTKEEGFRMSDSSYVELEKCVYKNCGRIVKEHFPDKTITRDVITYYLFDENYTVGVAFRDENPNLCGSVTHWDWLWLNQVYYPRYK